MAQINTVADYIISALLSDGNGFLSNLKLQKLLYYVEAWHLGIMGSRFYNPEEYFEAWVHGPVNRTIYERFSETKYLYSDITLEDRREKNPSLSKDDREFVDYILEYYGKLSGMELETLTHKEAPWIEARGGIEPFEACTKKISVETMQRYYHEIYERI